MCRRCREILCSLSEEKLPKLSEEKPSKAVAADDDDDDVVITEQVWIKSKPNSLQMFVFLFRLRFARPIRGP